MATKKSKKTLSASPKSESAEARFMRLAVPRVQAALKRIKLIGNLAASSYVSTPEQRAKILSALNGAVEELEMKFNKNKTAEEQFTL